MNKKRDSLVDGRQLISSSSFLHSMKTGSLKQFNSQTGHSSPSPYLYGKLLGHFFKHFVLLMKFKLFWSCFKKKKVFVDLASGIKLLEFC